MSEKYIAYPNGEKYNDGQVYSGVGNIERTEKFHLGNRYLISSSIEPIRQSGGERTGDYYSRAVIEGNFTYPNGKAVGTVTAFTVFTARHENGALTGEGVQRYSIKPGIIKSDSEIYTYLSTPSALKGDWYYEWGDMNVASDKENAVYLPAPVYTDRAKLNELPGAEVVQIFFRPGWYQQIFESEPSWSSGSQNGSGEPGWGGAVNNSLQLIVSDTQVDEGSTVTTKIEGTAGQTLYYRVTGNGVSKKDFAAGGVKGSVKANANEVATISHTLRADKATEGEESFAIQVFSDKKMRNLLGQSDAVTVFDTSVKAGKGGKGNTNTDPLTGEVIFGMKYGYDLATSSGTSRYDRYFLKANPQAGGFDVWGDSNQDKLLGASDPYLGFASANFMNSAVMGEAGTFATNSQRNILNIFIGNQTVATLGSGEIFL